MKTITERAAEAERQTARIEAFSDGVFAIVITLLIFDVRIPPVEGVAEGGLLGAVLGRWPNLVGFAASFFFILIMWINHHRLFTVIRRSDNNLLLLNGLLLLGVTLVPFPTALVAAYLQHPDRTMAVMIYNGWFVVVALFFNLLWRYAAHENRLFTVSTDLALVKHISGQYSFGPVLYLGAMLLALISPVLSLAASFALAVFFAIPNRDVQRLMEGE